MLNEQPCSVTFPGSWTYTVTKGGKDPGVWSWFHSEGDRWTSNLIYRRSGGEKSLGEKEGEEWVPGKEGGPPTPQGRGRPLWWGKRQLKVAECACYPRDLMPVSPDLPGSVGILTARGKPMIPILFHTLSSEPPPPLSTPHPEASLTPSGFSNSRLVEESSQHLVLFACFPHAQAGLPPPNHFASKDASSQSYGFSSSHVWMWQLDH